VVADLLAAGAQGACVNLGGDLRAAGTGPDDGGGWTVAVEHPGDARPIALVGLRQGAVATSTTLRRRWRVQGGDRHHLIDPRTGGSSATGVDLVTVVAGEAWICEVLAKATLLAGTTRPFQLVERSGAAALAAAAGD